MSDILKSEQSLFSNMPIFGLLFILFLSIIFIIIYIS